MEHFSDTDSIVLKIGHYLSADNKIYIAISKDVVADMGVVFCLRRRDNNFLMHFFSASEEVFDTDQIITFGLEEEVINHISRKTGLVFELEREAGGNVCFANSPELRNDYKISFSVIDVINYIQRLMCTLDYAEKHKEFLKVGFLVLPYPADDVAFWK